MRHSMRWLNVLCLGSATLVGIAACGSNADSPGGASGGQDAGTQPGATDSGLGSKDAGTGQGGTDAGPPAPVCGNGARETGESCDDANALGGDGCSATCQVEPLYACTGAGPGSCVRTPGQWAQEAYLKASNPGAIDRFGRAVALSADGSTLAVGAAYEDSAATGIGGNQASNTMYSAGAVYVFKRSGDTWAQEAYVKASNAGDSDRFGWALALSSDGSTLAVGASNESSSATGVGGDQNNNVGTGSGAVYMFKRTASTWSQEAYLKASNTDRGDAFGTAVALSSDGNTLAVGAYTEYSAATGLNGNQADNTARESGAAYVFQRTGAAWAQTAYVKASNTGAFDQFGSAVALSGDGNTLAVGANLEDGASAGVNGNQADNGAEDSGAVYVYLRGGNTWTQTAYVKASNPGAADGFGASLALSGDGSTLLVGAPGEASLVVGVPGGGVTTNQADNSAYGAGAAYVFKRTGTTWAQDAFLKASNAEGDDAFGTSVALSADGVTIAVSALSEGSAATGVNGNQLDNSASWSGATYVFLRSGSNWTQEAYLKASNTASSDYFGYSVSLSSDGNLLGTGASGEASSAVGVNGNQSDNSLEAAGASYVFQRKPKP